MKKRPASLLDAGLFVNDVILLLGGYFLHLPRLLLSQECLLADLDVFWRWCSLTAAIGTSLRWKIPAASAASALVASNTSEKCSTRPAFTVYWYQELRENFLERQMVARSFGGFVSFFCPSPNHHPIAPGMYWVCFQTENSLPKFAHQF